MCSCEVARASLVRTALAVCGDSDQQERRRGGGRSPEEQIVTLLSAAAPPIPEPGQVVEVRGSTWAVANVQAQGLPRSPADEAVASLTTSSTCSRSTRTASASSCRWSGSWRSATPSPRPRDCRRRINPEAVRRPRRRWPGSSTRCAGVRSPRADPNRYQAPFWSGVNVEAYQLEPLRRALGAPAHEPAARRRRRPGQDDRGRPGHPGAAAAPPGPHRGDRVPAEPVAEVAGRDARQVRPASSPSSTAS